MLYKSLPVSGWLVAHRAACLDAPENSVEAVRLAAKTGTKWIEFDVSFSSDLSAVDFMMILWTGSHWPAVR